MSAPDAAAPRICQVCGYANSSLSLFCAECGSVLSADASASQSRSPDRQDDLDSQQTRPFTPPTAHTPSVNPGDERWAPSSSAATGDSSQESTTATTTTTTSFTPQSGSPETRMAQPSTGTSETAVHAPVWSATPDLTGTGTSTASYEDEPESLRGFFLGVFAILLILVVAAIYAWTILPGGSLRDSIQSWIDAIG